MEKLTKEEVLNRICEQKFMGEHYGARIYSYQLSPEKLAEFLTETINNLISK